MDHRILVKQLTTSAMDKKPSIPMSFKEMEVKMTTIKPSPLQSGNVTFVDLGKELLQAAKDGNKEKVLECLKQGAPMTSDWLGTSPLHIAAKSNHFEICTILIRAGVSKDAKTKVDRTALHFATFEGNVDIVKMLLSCKCEVDATDMLKMTPLHWAVENNFPNISELLLEHGANPNFCSKFGKTPLSMANEKGDLALVELMESYIHTSNYSKNSNCEAINSLNQHEITLEEVKKLENLQHPAFTELNGSSDRPKKIKKDHAENQNLTLQILRDHGIQMIQPDVDDLGKNLIQSALQDGRRIILSEAGKMMLNVLPKLPQNTTITSQPSATTQKSISVRPVPPLSKLDESEKHGGSSSLMSQKQNYRILSQKEFLDTSLRSHQKSVTSAISSASKAIKKNPKHKFQALQESHFSPSSPRLFNDDQNFSTIEDYLDDATSTSTPAPPTTPLTSSFPSNDIETLIEKRFGEMNAKYRDLQAEFLNEQKKSESYRRKLLQLQKDFLLYKQEQHEKFNSMLREMRNPDDIIMEDQDVIEEDFL